MINLLLTKKFLLVALVTLVTFVSKAMNNAMSNAMNNACNRRVAMIKPNDECLFYALKLIAYDFCSMS